MTAIQLYSEYRYDVLSLENSLIKAELSFVPGLVEALWIFDEVLVQRQLDGLVQFEGVEFAKVTGAEGIEAAAGSDVRAPYSRTNTIPLTRMTEEGVITLGALDLVVSHRSIIDQTIQRAVIVLVTNFVKTICVAIIILGIYQQKIGRHIAHLAHFARTHDLEEKGISVALDRPHSREQNAPDELSSLTTAMNEWIATSQAHIAALTKIKDAFAKKNEELQLTNQQLQSANREQAEFTYAISHDLKAPTNTMGMLIDELMEERELDDTSEGVMADMIATNRRMGQLVEDVLDYSRIVGERIVAAEIDLNSVVDDVLIDLSAEITKAEAVVSKSKLPTLIGHPIQIRILVQNMIANAVKFRSDERPPRIEIRGWEDENEITLSIADNGIGIPPVHHERIFGLFQRLHTHSAYEGTGLGLAICSRILANHKGRVELGDGIDGGTTFFMTFRK